MRPRCKYQGGERPCRRLVYRDEDRCRRHILRDAGWARVQRNNNERWYPPEGEPVAFPHWGLDFESAWERYRRAS